MDTNDNKKYFQNKSRYKPKYNESITRSKEILNGIVAYNEYGGYFAPLSSLQRPAVQKILVGDVYEPQTIKFMRDNCSVGDIVHAGTFFGDFLPGLSKALSKNAKLWAFEPNIENFRCANITMLINNLNNVILNNLAVGEDEATLKMLVESLDGEALGGASENIKKR